MPNTPSSLRLATVAAALCTLSAGELRAQLRGPASRLDEPIATAWTVRRAWDAAAEREFGQFVSTIGHAAAAHRCRTLAACLNDPAVNPLREPGGRPLRFRADCADVPYTLRGYFAFHHGLPFAWSREMRGHGRDRRYLSDAHPAGLRLWTGFRTPREVLEGVGSEVHSGYLRTAPGVEDGDFYQAAVSPRAIRPGSVYYDPNGHVLVVYEVRADGEVLLFDGHPDNSLTHVRLTERYPLGGARQGGGFKNFRPLVWRGGALALTPNAELPDYGGAAQFERARYGALGYHAWVRRSLRATLASEAEARPGPQ